MRVSDEAARKFTSLYTLLMYYAGQERRVLPHDMDLDDFKNSSLGVKIRCRDAIYEPTPLIRKFLDANRDLLTDEAQATLALWARSHLCGSFVVLKHLRKYSIFYSSQGHPKAYGVLGLTGELSEMIPKQALPVVVRTVLMPYDGVIVCDGLIAAADHAILGPNVRREMAAEYGTLKEAGDIITTLG